MMSEETIAVVQQRLGEVKREIKKYERAFQAEHGRPAERDEIKSDATICMYTRVYRLPGRRWAN